MAQEITTEQLRFKLASVILSLEHINKRFERMDLEPDFDKFETEITEEVKIDRGNLLEVYEYLFDCSFIEGGIQER
tara:strand:+ start:336 stop:563 length:228 start_codon:yes stop_codon:yes gene_type:complete